MSGIGGPAYRLAALLETAVVRALRLRNRYPPLFIVGAPRSGTTVVYLHLLNRLRFGYFPNVSKRHPAACVTAAVVGRLIYDHEPTYRSRYGIVEGPMAPSDGWDIFHRWFPRYDDGGPVREARLYALRNIVRLLEHVFGAPFANKNNHSSVRIPFLDGVFPNALFVHVERKIADTVESLIAARRANDVPVDAWWGVAPPQLLGHRFDGELERAVGQVWGVRRVIERAFGRIDASRRCTITYERFCRDPDHIVDWVRSRYANANVALDPADHRVRMEIALPRHSHARRGRIVDLVGRFERSSGSNT